MCFLFLAHFFFIKKNDIRLKEKVISIQIVMQIIIKIKPLKYKFMALLLLYVYVKFIKIYSLK